MPRHFLDLFSLSEEDAGSLLRRSIELKSGLARGERPAYLKGQTLGLLFEKQSLRTRVSFEAAMVQLGGAAIFLRNEDVSLGVRETVADFARIISQYVEAVVVRTYSHGRVEELARVASIPVINALSDTDHPCQAMADMMTIRELKGRTEGVKVTFVGDGNNVARSLAQSCALLGAEITLACPPDYTFPADYLAKYGERFAGRQPRIVHDAREGVRNADIVYTDVWTSMGQEEEADVRRLAFEPFRVDEAMMSLARPDASFMHCLPARRGEEVTPGVLDGPRSEVVRQAANRLHFQKGLLLWLMESSAAAT